MSVSAETAAPTKTASGPAVLDLVGINASYGRVKVLHDVDLRVSAGSTHAVLGANGAGKTTLLRVASGLLRPASGTVRVKGADHSHSRPSTRARAGVCLIPEGRGVFRSLTVRENLVLQVPPWNRKNADIEKALATFPILRRRLGQTAGSLSGGEQQMLALSRCYLAAPAVIMLDEVSMGLAPRIVDQIFEILAELAKQGTALVVVEQYIGRALQMADTVHLLARGEIVFTGQSSELDTDEVMRGYLGADISASAAD